MVISTTIQGKKLWLALINKSFWTLLALNLVLFSLIVNPALENILSLGTDVAGMHSHHISLVESFNSTKIRRKPELGPPILSTSLQIDLDYVSKRDGLIMQWRRIHDSNGGRTACVVYALFERPNLSNGKTGRVGPTDCTAA